MPLLLTAFGPFAGRRENASSLALASLAHSRPDLHTLILPVDSIDAPRRLLATIASLRPSLILMLGEAAGSTTIRIETTSYNELDFSIPDIAGRQPRSHPIFPDAPPSLPSALPSETLVQALSRAGLPASLSHDPGRYLCNQIFFTTRHLAPHIPAGFVHLPLADQLPTHLAHQALVHILSSLNPPPSPEPPAVSKI